MTQVKVSLYIKDSVLNVSRAFSFKYSMHFARHFRCLQWLYILQKIERALNRHMTNIFIKSMEGTTLPLWQSSSRKKMARKSAKWSIGEEQVRSTY